MEMKLAVQSAVFWRFPLELAIAGISNAGYTGIELWGGRFHAYPFDFCKSPAGGELDERRIKSVRELTDKYGLEIVCYTPEQCVYPINYLCTDAYPFDMQRARDESISYLKTAIDIADGLGTKKMLITTPFWKYKRVGGEYKVMESAEIYEKSVRVLGELVDYAYSRGVVLILEPLSHLETTSVETLSDLEKIMKDINSPNLKAMVDTGHVHVTARKHGESTEEHLREYIEKLGKSLVHVHLDDNFGVEDQHLIPGEGEIDFRTFINTLMDSGYEGYLSVELAISGGYALEPEKAVRASRKYLLECLK